MKILFDQGTPVPLRKFLIGHEIETAHERGWDRLSNGILIEAAESEEFEVFLTTDKNLQYQQNLDGRTIAILVLPTTAWPVIQTKVVEVTNALDQISPGDYVELDFTA